MFFIVLHLIGGLIPPKKNHCCSILLLLDIIFFTAETAGRAALGGAALFGVGALCYYGLGLSNEVGAIDRAMVWPQVVRDRVRSTYTYFAGSLAVTAATAYGISQSRAIYTMMRASPWLVSVLLLLKTPICFLIFIFAFHASVLGFLSPVPF